MPFLTLRHIPGDLFRFLIIQPTGKSTSLRELKSASGYPVAERPGSDLLRELRWYLESFLAYPFPPETDRANRVLAALRNWGEEAFAAVFGDREGGGMLDRATREGYDRLRLIIASDDPSVLSWPWEALYDPLVGPLGQVSQIERRLDRIGDPPALSPELPQDQINILLVTARPYKEDVGYRAVSRSLVELIESRELPAKVHLLRPPTFARLREHLRERPHYYHLLHFDGHGGYTAPASQAASQSHTLQGPQGKLLFETDKGLPDSISVEQLGPLLREVAVPVVVLNACQSGMLDGEAESAFASVAASLILSGVRSVVAMAYSLYVSGAEQFLPSFYTRLFENGSVAEAVRAGRQQMLARPGRVCARGHFNLNDWLVPVLYQQEDVDFSFAANKRSRNEDKAATLAREVTGEPELGQHGLIGRDREILKLERALRSPAVAILIQGMSGVGKTALVHGFIRWLRATEGLGACLWLDFRQIGGVEHLFNRIGTAAYGDSFRWQPEKLPSLISTLRKERFLLIWDNFEAAMGNNESPPLFSNEDRDALLSFLRALRGCGTRVLITSRGDERWLGEERLKISLGGLEGEGRWQLFNSIAERIGLELDRSNRRLQELVEILAGHPLTMRVVIPELERYRPEDLIEMLLSTGFDEGEQGRLDAVLHFTENAVPEHLHPLLAPLALHQQYVDLDVLELIAARSDRAWTREAIASLLATLSRSGVIRHVSRSLFEMHPALTSFLRSRVPAWMSEEDRESWALNFVIVTCQLADEVSQSSFHEHRSFVARHLQNLRGALAEAKRLAFLEAQGALLQALAYTAQNTGNLNEAERLFSNLSSIFDRLISEGRQAEAGKAVIFHQLGRVAEEQHRFADAKERYLKALHLAEKFEQKESVAKACHQLGVLAQKEHDLLEAERWMTRSVELKEELDDRVGLCKSYHELGMIESAKRDFEAAEIYFKKALAASAELQDEFMAATTNHELGMLMFEQWKLDLSLEFLTSSLKVRERLGDEPGQASTLSALGLAAEEQGKTDLAYDFYRRSLEIDELRGDLHGAAVNYHRLGRLASRQGNLAEAEEWSKRSIEIKEILRDEAGVATTYALLGSIVQEKGDLAAAEAWYGKALTIQEKFGDKAGLAITCHQLGMLAEETNDLDRAEELYKKSLGLAQESHDLHGASKTLHQLAKVAAAKERCLSAASFLMSSIAGFIQCGDLDHARVATSSFIALFEDNPGHREELRDIWTRAGLPKIDFEAVLLKKSDSP